MLCVFYPTRGALSSEEERLLGWSCDGVRKLFELSELVLIESYNYPVPFTILNLI